MQKHISNQDLSQVKLRLACLKSKISLAQEFLKQVQDEVYLLQESVLDDEDIALDKLQIYINQL